MVVTENWGEVGVSARKGIAPVLRKVAIRGTVAGLLLELEVEQHFHNASQRNVEAVYTFPLPPDAVLLEMDCSLGERKLCGTIYPAAQGEQQYEAALEQGDTPVMVQSAGAGHCTVNIGNLQAGEVAVVRYRFAQLLAYIQGQIRIGIPTVIAPRYGNPASAGLAPHQQPYHQLAADYPCTLDLQLSGVLQEGAISSPTHALSVRMVDGKLSLSLAKSARMDRDIVVLIDGLQGQSLAVCGNDETSDETVVLASLCSAAAGVAVAQPVAMKVLVDCSGSMAGDSMDSARRALHDMLRELTPADSLSLSAFGSTVAHHRAGIHGATPEFITTGLRWSSELSANMGGTELAQALSSTCRLAGKADILLLTDGQIADVESVIELARNMGHRVFVVAIGTAPAGSLLQRLADETGGVCEFVAPLGDIHGAILRTFRRMRQPPVQELTLDWQAPVSWQVAPRSVLFEEETTHALAAFAGTTPPLARLNWLRQGQAGELNLPLDEQMVRLPGDTLARLAAWLRLSKLAAEDQRTMALRYRLLTSDTRLLLVHERAPGEQALEPAALHSVAQMLPAGWGGTSSVCLSTKETTIPYIVASPKAPVVWCRASTPISPDRYEIPAFLRKLDVDQVNPDLQQAAARKAIEEFVCATYRRWTLLSKEQVVPGCLADWSEDLPDLILDMLNGLQRGGAAEGDVIGAFLAVLSGIARRLGCQRDFHQWLLARAPLSSRSLQAQISDRLTELTGWAVTQGLGLHRSLARRLRHAQPVKRYDVPLFVEKRFD